MTTLIRTFKDLRYRLFYWAFLKRNPGVISLGDRSTGCAWNFNPNGLDANSVVYGGGVGRDITFEQALVKRFGCSIVLFDPSPTGLETMADSRNHDPHFKFCPVALSGRCGMLKFGSPINETEGSWSAHRSTATTVEVPAVDLKTLMEQNGHNHIDLLKIDIEGAEYEVLEDLLNRRIPVRQVLVEFHHGILAGVRRSQSVRAIWKMRSAGYELLNQEGSNHTFLLPPDLFEKRCRLVN